MSIELKRFVAISSLMLTQLSPPSPLVAMPPSVPTYSRVGGPPLMCVPGEYQGVLVPMDLFVAHTRKAIATIRRDVQPLEPEVDAIRILRVHTRRLVVTALIAWPFSAGGTCRERLGPRCAAVGGLKQTQECLAEGRNRRARHPNACVQSLVIGLSGLRESDESKGSRRRTRVGEQVGRERHTAVGRPEDPPHPQHRRVDRRGGRGVEVEVRDEASEDRLAVVEGRGVGAEVEAPVDGEEEASSKDGGLRWAHSEVRRHQQHVRGGEHDAVDATSGEDAAGIEDGPRLARVNGLVEADPLEETPQAAEAPPPVEDIAR